MSPGFLVTAEHAARAVPRELRARFDAPSARAALASHRGSDPGSLALARELGRRLDAPVLAARVSRLVVDANRSLGHPRLFGEWTRALPADERERLVDAYWRPHREAVERSVARLVRRHGTVVHLAIHTFTPVLDGVVRPMDAALLYDPGRRGERDLAGALVAALRRGRPDLVLARNRPYRGTSDGLTTHLRSLYPDPSYAGIEVEVNQRWPQGARGAWRRLVADLAGTIAAVVA